MPNSSSRDLQALLDAAVDGIVVIDHLGSICNFNRAAEALFGVAASETLGRNISVLMPEEERSAHDGYLARYLTTRIPHIIGRGREVTAQRWDGSRFPAFLSVGVVASEPPRFVGFIRDVTQQQRSEHEARRLQERLLHVSRLATLGEMASGISHELNQPLTAIASYAYASDRLLGTPEPDVKEVRSALQQIAAQAVRAGDIIRRLRSLAGSEESPRMPADLNTVLDELTDLIESDAKAHGVIYRRELAADLPRVIIDRAQIQQVVLNLVRNALEALTAPRAKMGQLLIRTVRTAAGDAQIRVCDNGPGVDPAIVQNIFEPFCSTKPQGTGLGLTISRTIVHRHRGTLEFECNTPAGACFVITLASQAEVQP